MDEAVFTNKEAIIDFLNQYGRGSNTKDYEFLIALVMAGFVEKQCPDSQISIGFKLKPEALRLIEGTITTKLSTLAEVIRNDIKEDEPVDFIIGVKSLERMGGIEFQAKRFGLGRKKKGTKEFVQYINSIKKKYGRVGGTLILLIDQSKEEIDTPTLLRELDITDYPYDRIMMTWMTKDLIHVGEIYPQQGMEQFNIDELLLY